MRTLVLIYFPNLFPSVTRNAPFAAGVIASEAVVTLNAVALETVVAVASEAVASKGVAVVASVAAVALETVVAVALEAVVAVALEAVVVAVVSEAVVVVAVVSEAVVVVASGALALNAVAAVIFRRESQSGTIKSDKKWARLCFVHGNPIHFRHWRRFVSAARWSKIEKKKQKK